MKYLLFAMVLSVVGEVSGGGEDTRQGDDMPTAEIYGNYFRCLNPVEIRVTLTGSPPWTVTWSDGEVQEFDTSPGYRQVFPATDTFYSLSSVSSGGTEGHVSGTVSVRVTRARLDSQDEFICPDDGYSLVVNLFGTPPFLLTWSDGEVEITESLQAIRLVNPKTTTYYELVAVEDYYCSAGEIEENGVTLTVSEAAARVSGSSMICRGDKFISLGTRRVPGFFCALCVQWHVNDSCFR